MHCNENSLSENVNIYIKIFSSYSSQAVGRLCQYKVCRLFCLFSQNISEQVSVALLYELINFCKNRNNLGTLHVEKDFLSLHCLIIFKTKLIYTSRTREKSNFKCKLAFFYIETCEFLIYKSIIVNSWSPSWDVACSAVPHAFPTFLWEGKVH
jgi:hypothetical protein